MIKFRCPHCNQKMGVPDEYATRRVRCRKCNQPSRVPQAQSASKAVPISLEVVEEPPHQIQTAPQQTVESSPQQSDSFESDQVSGFAPDLDIGLVESSPDREVIAVAKAARDKQRYVHRRSSVRTSRSTEGGLRLSGLAVGAGKVPLSIAAALAFGIGVCIIWIIIAKFTGFNFSYFAVGVAAASAYGLVVFTENRNVGLGIAAIFIGLFCILIGKFMVAKWAIMASDEYQEIQTEMAEGIKEGMGSVPFSQMSKEEQSWLIEDPMIIYNMGVMELWEQRQFDKITSQKLIMSSFVTTFAEEESTDPEGYENEHQAVMEHIITLAEEGPEGYENEHQAVMEHIRPWTETQKTQALDTYYNRYLDHFQDWLINSDLARGIGFIFAFICAFSLWDLIILPISAITAYKVASGGE